MATLMELEETVPAILIVDDDDEAQSGALNGIVSLGCRASALHPEEVSVDDVREADLVLVDYNLRDWPERDQSAIARQPTTGLSLMAVLRDFLSMDSDRPVGFALNTTRFGDLPTVLPRPVTKHALARANNFEWVFDKSDASDLLAACSLARACRALPDDWQEAGVLDALRRLVGLPDLDWTDAAVDHMLRCRPPIHELSRATDGLALLRWLLQRILPYPCFLMSRERLAVRLGISVEELDALLSSTSKASLSRLLAPCQYQGVLADFRGPRWWAAGVEAIIWDATGGSSFDVRVVRNYLELLPDSSLSSPVPSFPVLAVDEEYEYLTYPVEIDGAVRIQPDDWPSYADEAWTERRLLENSDRLRSLTHPDDL